MSDGIIKVDDHVLWGSMTAAWRVIRFVEGGDAILWHSGTRTLRAVNPDRLRKLDDKAQA